MLFRSSVTPGQSAVCGAWGGGELRGLRSGYRATSQPVQRKASEDMVLPTKWHQAAEAPGARHSSFALPQREGRQERGQQAASLEIWESG